mgnify:CR=1 FL=1
MVNDDQVLKCLLLRWFSVGSLAAAACLLRAPQTHAQPTAVVEHVDGLAGSIRYDGKKVVGVRCEKYPASDEDAKAYKAFVDGL